MPPRTRTRTRTAALGALARAAALDPAAPRSERLGLHNDPYAMSEAALTTHVIGAAKDLDYTLRYHTRDSRGSDKGFPDWVLVNVRRGRFILAELKKQDGTVKPEQKDWAAGLLELVRMGLRIEYYLWRPADWYSGDIQRILAARPA